MTKDPSLVPGDLVRCTNPNPITETPFNLTKGVVYEGSHVNEAGEFRLEGYGWQFYGRQFERVTKEQLRAEERAAEIAVLEARLAVLGAEEKAEREEGQR